MMMDLQNLFSKAQDITSEEATVASTNIIDLGAAGTMPAHYGTIRHEPFAGDTLQFFVQVDTTFTGQSNATVQVTLETHDDADFGSATTVYQSAATVYTSLVAGYHFKSPVSIPIGVCLRYLRVTYTIATAHITAGTITAGLLFDRDTNAMTYAQLA